MHRASLTKFPRWREGEERDSRGTGDRQSQLVALNLHMCIVVTKTGNCAKENLDKIPEASGMEEEVHLKGDRCLSFSTIFLFAFGPIFFPHVEQFFLLVKLF